MHLVMYWKGKEARAGVLDGDDIVDINAADRSLPSKRLPNPFLRRHGFPFLRL